LVRKSQKSYWDRKRLFCILGLFMFLSVWLHIWCSLIYGEPLRFLYKACKTSPAPQEYVVI
jgi:hypothetical protein